MLNKIMTLILFVLVVAVFIVGYSLLTDSTSLFFQEAPDTSSTGDSALKGHILFASHRTDKVDNVLLDLVNEFMKQHSDVNIEIESIKDNDVIKTRIAAAEMPDISLIPVSIPRRLFPKYLASLDDLGFTDENTHFYENGFGPDGRLYAVSNCISYVGFVYHKGVFKKAGIEKPPTTWDEFFTACALIKETGVIPLGTSFKNIWPVGDFGVSLEIHSSGNEDLQNELIHMDEIFGDYGIITGPAILRSMRKSGFIEPVLQSTNWDTMKVEMAQGKFGMVLLGTWFPPQLFDHGAVDDDVGMFPIPESKLQLLYPDVMYGVSKNSKHLEVSKAFLKFLFWEGKMANAIGVLPAWKGDTANPPYISELLSYSLPVHKVPLARDEFQIILNIAQIDIALFVQEYVAADDPEKVVAEYNQRWYLAKHSLGQ